MMWLIEQAFILTFKSVSSFNQLLTLFENFIIISFVLLHVEFQQHTRTQFRKPFLSEFNLSCISPLLDITQ